MTHYDFIIDTDSYAGNFERELCGYLTGHTDQDDDHEDTEEAKKELSKKDQSWFEEHIMMLPGGDGDATWDCPMELYPTPGYFNDGKGNLYKTGTKVKRYLDTDWPAYQSVGIHFDIKPPQRIVDLLKSRAATFCTISHQVMTVIGFRLLEIETTETEIEL